MRLSENDLLIYCISAQTIAAYQKPNTAHKIEELAEQWRVNYSGLCKDDIYEIAVELTQENTRDMNWTLDDIDGVTWFLGIYTRVILKSGVVNASFMDIMSTCMRKYFARL